MSIQDDYLDPDRHLWPAEEPEHHSAAWECLNTFYSLPDDNRNEELIKRCVYKYTDCGAWIEFDEHGIRLGSIVEGSDVDCQSYHLTWRKVTADAISERLDAIEKEADAIWTWANEARDDDGMTDAEAGCDCPDVSWDYRHLN
jgi:hypothetical protein